MKYLISIIILIPFLLISFLLGIIPYLWKFNKYQFKKGFNLLNNYLKVIPFLEKL